MPQVSVPASLVPASPTGTSGNERHDVLVEHHRQPPCETPEHTLSHHLIAVQLGQALQVEGKMDGRAYQHLALPGDLSVLPAGLPTQERWEGVAEYLVVRIAPSLFGELPCPANATFSPVPTLKTRDPLLHHIATTLYAELTGEAGDRFYAESLVTLLGAHLLRHYSER